MKQYLLLTSAFVAGGLLSGTAGAACIQTPSCSSLGYESTSACEGGVKCPFGNYWNCTGPNNTTEIKNIKNEITNIKNRITKLENNSGSGTGSGPRCADCEVGDFVCGGQCFSVEQAFLEDIYNVPSLSNIDDAAMYPRLYTFCTDIVFEKSDDGVCRKAPTKYSRGEKFKTLTYDEFMKDATVIKGGGGDALEITNNKIKEDLYKIQEAWDGVPAYRDIPEYFAEEIITFTFNFTHQNVQGKYYPTMEDYRDTLNRYYFDESFYGDIYDAVRKAAQKGKLKAVNITTFN